MDGLLVFTFYGNAVHIWCTFWTLTQVQLWKVSFHTQPSECAQAVKTWWRKPAHQFFGPILKYKATALHIWPLLFFLHCQKCCLKCSLKFLYSVHNSYVRGGQCLPVHHSANALLSSYKTQLLPKLLLVIVRRTFLNSLSGQIDKYKYRFKFDCWTNWKIHKCRFNFCYWNGHTATKIFKLLVTRQIEKYRFNFCCWS